MAGFYSPTAHTPGTPRVITRAERRRAHLRSGKIPNSPLPRGSRTPRSIEVRIEELVLHGLAPARKYSLVDVFERELSRLLSEDGATDSLVLHDGADRIHAGTFRLPRVTDTKSAGIGIARAVFGGLRR